MSTGLNCEIVERNEGEWYYVLESLFAEATVPTRMYGFKVW